jgi:acyl-CoA synthetase (NDP forming)
LPKGPRIAFVTTSGATVDLLYDYAEAEGAAMPDFTDETKAALLPMMQEGIAPKNPLDVGIPSTLEVAAKICETAARDPNIDMVAWASPMPRKGETWGDVAALRQLLTKTDKPVVAFGRVVQQLNDDHLAAQQAAGFPFLQGIEPTIRALTGLWFHAARRGRAPPLTPPAPASDLSPATLETTLARYGIALPKSRAVANAAEAVIAAERIGFPVALKIRSRDILHKTEVGGVALDLQNRDAVQAAAEALAASARVAQPAARIDGFLVQEMVSGIEAIVGARDDPFYGPLLLVGSGGVLVELVADAALRLLPVTAREVSTMVDGLKLAKRLSGFRGQPAADRAAFEAAALALARFFLDHRARIKDVEINPLMVRANNQSPAHDPQSKVHKPAGADPSVVAVDVRVLWREHGEGT